MKPNSIRRRVNRLGLERLESRYLMAGDTFEPTSGLFTAVSEHLSQDTTAAIIDAEGSYDTGNTARPLKTAAQPHLTSRLDVNNDGWVTAADVKARRIDSQPSVP